MKRFSIRSLFVAMMFVGGLCIFFTAVPCRAILSFPIQQRNHVNKLLAINGIDGKLSEFSFNGVSSIDMRPGWRIWMAESSILHDANRENYFCVVKYESLIGGRSWYRSFDSGVCAHGRSFRKCAECQSVTR